LRGKDLRPLGQKNFAWGGPSPRVLPVRETLTPRKSLPSKGTPRPVQGETTALAKPTLPPPGRQQVPPLRRRILEFPLSRRVPFGRGLQTRSWGDGTSTGGHSRSEKDYFTGSSEGKGGQSGKGKPLQPEQRSAPGNWRMPKKREGSPYSKKEKRGEVARKGKKISLTR